MVPGLEREIGGKSTPPHYFDSNRLRCVTGKPTMPRGNRFAAGSVLPDYARAAADLRSPRNLCSVWVNDGYEIIEVSLADLVRRG